MCFTEEYKKQLAATESWFKRPIANTPKFEKKAGESDRAFYSRVEVESNDFMKIAKFENENECKVIENEKGQMEVEKRVRRKQIKNKEYVLLIDQCVFTYSNALTISYFLYSLV